MGGRWAGGQRIQAEHHGRLEWDTYIWLALPKQRLSSQGQGERNLSLTDKVTEPIRDTIQ